MPSTNQSSLDALLQEWQELLSLWTQNGALTHAAQEALLLGEEPEILRLLVERWSAGDFLDLPPIELLPAATMPGAAGAYAFSTGTIYLNADWLQGASRSQALAVLSEELGHHLDGLLNASDTPGDEGALFAALLQRGGVSGEPERRALQAENDRGDVLVAGRELEQAAVVVSTPIPATYPGRTRGEWQNSRAFAALKADGSVVTWGEPSYGGDSSGLASQLSSCVKQIFSTETAFAALKVDGSVVTWGEPSYGGDSSGVASQLSSGVTQIFSTATAFAALKADGSIVTWGDSLYGGDSSTVISQLSLGVSQIFSNSRAFAALKADGSVVTWGDSLYGGDNSIVANQLSFGVTQILSTDSAFAALKTDGTLVTWGNSNNGGNQILSGVQKILSSTTGAFAVLMSDGSVRAFGDPLRGGNSRGIDELNSGVSQVFSTFLAFAALKNDGSVVTWGYPQYGGSTYSAEVDEQLRSGVSEIFSTGYAFAALKADGSVVTWGAFAAGGDSSAVASRLSSGVTHIFSNSSSIPFGAFAALKADGTVVTWGASSWGGDSSTVASQLSSGVTQIFSTATAFAALKADGSVVTWGGPSSGGDSSAVASELTNVVAFANPFTDDRLVLGGGGGTNNGSASFTVSGILAPNNYLHAVLKSSDPDGNGSFSYSWQTSSNGSSWSTVGSNRASYRLTANDAGKQVRLLVSYKDGGGFNETVVTAAGTVAYSPTHQNLEILAKDIIYKKTPFAIGFSIEKLPGFPYVVNKVWDDTDTGLYALGLSAPNAPSVLVFRGTGDKLDIWDDLNPNGIGFGQFTAAYDGIPVYDSIRQWLRDQDSTYAPIITGHSLGGSLAQWAAADATGNGNINLGEVVTFNSPGISPSQTFAANQFGANVFNSLLAGNVTHYITSSDLVSLGGTKYLPGSYKLFDYSSLLDPVVGPHLNPVLVPELPVSGKTRPTGGDPEEKPFWFLNSPLYGYNTDIDFIALRLAIAGVAKLAAAIPGIGTVVASIINSGVVPVQWTGR